MSNNNIMNAARQNANALENSLSGAAKNVGNAALRGARNVGNAASRGARNVGNAASRGANTVKGLVRRNGSHVIGGNGGGIGPAWTFPPSPGQKKVKRPTGSKLSRNGGSSREVCYTLRDKQQASAAGMALDKTVSQCGGGNNHRNNRPSPGVHHRGGGGGNHRGNGGGGGNHRGNGGGGGSAPNNWGGYDNNMAPNPYASGCARSCASQKYYNKTQCPVNETIPGLGSFDPWRHRSSYDRMMQEQFGGEFCRPGRIPKNNCCDPCQNELACGKGYGGGQNCQGC
jgi:hypothetical protein